MMRRTLWYLLAVLVPLAVAGCGAGSSSPSSSSSSSSSSGVPSPSASSSPSASASPGSSSAPSGALVQFGRHGGIAGVSDTLVVNEDGHFTLVRLKPAVQKTGQLSASDLADLRRALADCGFAQLPKVQAARGADLFSYQVTYRDNQILAQDGGIAPQLQPVISMLSGYVAKYSG
jgi:hypothetical protein